jgi:hypothetical protein
MGWELPHDGGVETLAGFLLVHMQKIPAVGDFIVSGGRKFTIVAMENRRITRVRVEPETILAETAAPGVANLERTAKTNAGDSLNTTHTTPAQSASTAEADKPA